VAANPDHTADEGPLFCDRCLAELKPGTGTFYRINIEAVADPTPPTITAEDMENDLRQQIEDLLAQMRDVSQQEAMDQVYRRVTLFLCIACYRKWIENPV
jgi:hypothetical protein